MQNSDTPKVSLLVPICNVERYLRECLDSAVAQTLKNIEIICINDGSTDSSPDIIREYMECDARVKMIDKANSGYGDSMNRGLEMARGEYVGILESDDFMFEDSLQKLVAKADAEHADVVKGDFYLYWSTPSERRELFGIIDEHMTGAAYRPADRPGFNFKVWASAERAAFIADPILCYRQDNEKSSVNSPNKVFCVCDEYSEMQRFLDERPELKARLQGILMRMKVDTYRWNDERLVDELREQFWEKASPELKADWDAGRFDLSLFDPRGETDLRLMVKSPRAYIDSRFDFKKPGKLNTFKHYFKIGGLPLVWRVLTYQRAYGDNPHPDDVPAAQ